MTPSDWPSTAFGTTARFIAMTGFPSRFTAGSIVMAGFPSKADVNGVGNAQQ